MLQQKKKIFLSKDNVALTPVASAFKNYSNMPQQQQPEQQLITKNKNRRQTPKEPSLKKKKTLVVLV